MFEDSFFVGDAPGIPVAQNELLGACLVPLRFGLPSFPFLFGASLGGQDPREIISGVQAPLQTVGFIMIAYVTELSVQAGHKLYCKL